MKLFQFLNKKKVEKFKCICCGKKYDEIPLTFGSEYPIYYYSIPKNEVLERVEYQKSLCIIDEHFFHRVRIEIPIINYKENLNFDIWTSISKENFIKRNEDWNNQNRVNNEPYFGWLQNEIPTYENTFNLKTISKENKPGQIPNAEIIEECNLQSDQKNGITLEKATEIAQKILKVKHNQL